MNTYKVVSKSPWTVIAGLIIILVTAFLFKMTSLTHQQSVLILSLVLIPFLIIEFFTRKPAVFTVEHDKYTVAAYRKSYTVYFEQIDSIIKSESEKKPRYTITMKDGKRYEYDRAEREERLVTAGKVTALEDVIRKIAEQSGRALQDKTMEQLYRDSFPQR